MLIPLLALIGVALSAYAYYVERKATNNPGYHAVCDLGKSMSCTKALLSEYGHYFDISNSLIGFFYYIILLYLSFELDILLIPLSFIAVLVSLYLAYIQYAKLKNFCIICTLMYVLNSALFVASLYLF